MEALISAGVSTNVQATKGETVLMLASKEGHDSIVRFLCSNDHEKADPNIVDCDGESALFWACRDGHLKCVQELVAHGANTLHKNKAGMSPIEVSVSHCSGASHLNIIHHLFEHMKNHHGVTERKNFSNNKGDNLLSMSSRYGHYNCVEILLRLGSDPNTSNMYGQTPLMIGSKYGHEFIVELLCTSEPIKSNVNQSDNQGNTALFYACRKGHLGCVKSLLQHKANANQRNKYQESPLMLACKGGYQDIVSYLLTNEYDKADVNLLNDRKQNEFVIAAEAGHLNILKELTKYGAKIDLQDIQGKNSLMHSASKGHYEIVQHLTETDKTLPHIIDTNGNNSLIHACRTGQLNCVKELLSKGAIVNHQNNFSETGLMHACLGNHCDIVELLCAKGALINITDHVTGHRSDLLLYFSQIF